MYSLGYDCSANVPWSPAVIVSDYGWWSAAAAKPCPAGHPGRRGRPRRRPAADRRGRDQRGQSPGTPARLVLDRHLVGAPRPAARARSAVVAPGGDIFDGQTIDRFDVAATGTSSRCRLASPVTRDPGSTTPRPRSPRCCAAPRRTSWPTATQATWPGYRRRRAAVTELAGDHHRPHPGAAGAHQDSVQVRRSPRRYPETSGPGQPQGLATCPPDGRPRRAPSTSSCPSWRWPSWRRC